MGRLDKITAAAAKVNVRVVAACKEFEYTNLGGDHEHLFPSRILLEPWRLNDQQARRMFDRWESSPYAADKELPRDRFGNRRSIRVGDRFIPRRYGVALAVTDPDDMPELVELS